MKVRRPKKKVVPSLSEQELQRLFGQPLSKRDRACLMVLAGCGLRVGEAINLKFSDIGEDRITVRGKTGERVVPLDRQVRDALLTLQDGHELDAPIFWGTHPTQPLGHSGFRSIVRKAFKSAGIEGKRASPHTLRHSFARNWITRGGDTASLMEILGHSSLELTQRYVALSAEDLVDKNRRFNPLISLADDNITPDDDSIPTVNQELPL